MPPIKAIPVIRTSLSSGDCDLCGQPAYLADGLCESCAQAYQPKDHCLTCDACTGKCRSQAEPADTYSLLPTLAWKILTFLVVCLTLAWWLQ